MEKGTLRWKKIQTITKKTKPDPPRRTRVYLSVYRDNPLSVNEKQAIFTHFFPFTTAITLCIIKVSDTENKKK